MPHQEARPRVKRHCLHGSRSASIPEGKCRALEGENLPYLTLSKVRYAAIGCIQYVSVSLGYLMIGTGPGRVSRLGLRSLRPWTYLRTVHSTQTAFMLEWKTRPPLGPPSTPVVARIERRGASSASTFPGVSKKRRGGKARTVGPNRTVGVETGEMRREAFSTGPRSY